MVIIITSQPESHQKALTDWLVAHTNSSGTFHFPACLTHIVGSDLREEFGTSVHGLVWAMQHAAAAMRAKQCQERDRFAIVNIASTAVFVTFPGLTAYSAAKASVRQLSKSAALELAQFNIRYMIRRQCAHRICMSPCLGAVRCALDWLFCCQSALTRSCADYRCGMTVPNMSGGLPGLDDLMCILPESSM